MFKKRAALRPPQRLVERVWEQQLLFPCPHRVILDFTAIVKSFTYRAHWIDPVPKAAITVVTIKAMMLSCTRMATRSRSAAWQSSATLAEVFFGFP